MLRHASSLNTVRALGAVLMVAVAAVATAVPGAAQDRDLRNVVRRVEPAVVAVGTFQPARHPPVELMGTGFGVGDGSMVLTNAHVIPRDLDYERRERIAIVRGKRGADGNKMELITPSHICRDDARDLALLVLTDRKLPAALGLDTKVSVEPGLPVAFTGYPLSSAVGLSPVTHRGIVSAVAPAAVPWLTPVCSTLPCWSACATTSTSSSWTPRPIPATVAARFMTSRQGWSSEFSTASTSRAPASASFRP